jgi:molybdopterin molybdotransferase
MSKKNYLDFDVAYKEAFKYAKSAGLKEIIPLERSIGRVLAKDINCVKNLPSFNNSAMDGFAVKHGDAGKTLKVVTTIFAGNTSESILQQNECYKIMTGAKVPDDADTIVPIENVVSYEKDVVVLPQTLKKGNNLRVKGEEKSLEQTLFNQGDEINAPMVAVLASQGIVMVEVYKKLSIAVVSTGNELKEPWESASEDEIYNCNSFALIAQLQEQGFDATYTGVIPDNLEKSLNFVKGLKNYDVIITTGGISLGDADFMAEAFKENGLNTIFHGVNIKPGRPIMMGKMGKTFVMCLPGNPLTAMVNMHLFSIPVLRKIQGFKAFYHDIETAVALKTFNVKQGRVNVVLGNLKTGGFEVTKDNKYGSGMITVLSESNSIIVTREEKSVIEFGDSVNVIKFNNNFIDHEKDIKN